MRNFQTHVSRKKNLIDLGSIRWTLFKGPNLNIEIFGTSENYFLGMEDFLCFVLFNEVILTVGVKHLRA